jgi:hypothetical protein
VASLFFGKDLRRFLTHLLIGFIGSIDFNLKRSAAQRAIKDARNTKDAEDAKNCSG